ncbi:MAG TPA: hypothetical protein VHU84_19405 [Lacipirellulaceae bacterium]|jgi:hypothetical protein|nr:hypothetical protein [Lacipirellulaceae bacterium]
MAISNPVAVYNAENNAEAQMLCNFLEANGVEAYVTRDESVVGLWTFGTLPEIHKPQVWVDRASIDPTAPLLAEYERERARRRASQSPSESKGEPIAVLCEDCGKTSSFAASQRGTVQDCSHCGSFVDVEEGDDEAEWWNEEG